MEPAFKPIALSDKKIFQAYLAQCPRMTSDYTFVNIWSWASAYDLTFARTDELLWIRQKQPEPQYWAPVGNWQAVDWPRYFERFPQFKFSLIRVPEALARIWEAVFRETVSVAPDRDQFDYLYDANELITLTGNRFHKKRNLLNQFRKKYDYQYVKMTPDLVAAAMAMQNNWCAWRECGSDNALINENRAILKVLSSWEELDGIIGGCLLVRDKMIAYAIGERLGDDTLVVHFEKGSTDYKGVYQAINQMFVAHVASAASESGGVISRVNREQDLGDEGLRQSKESYQPVGFLKKFRVSWIPV